MHPDQHTEEESRQGQKTEHTDEMNTVVSPAKLPAHTRAAAAQRLNDVPQRPVRGLHYEGPHLQTAPRGWRTKRHLRRKNLRQSNLRSAAADRFGTRLALLPIALSTLVVLLIAATVFITYTAVFGATEHRFEQEVTTLQDILPKDNLKAYDMHGAPFYQMTDQGTQTSLPLDKISANLQHAEIATEDVSFWSNPGYDITGIVRAALEDLTTGHVVEGGSTITQQLIKNTIVGDKTSAIRKLQEIILAPQLTRHYSKQQILDMYLNTSYYGEQSYGAEAATFTYFGLQDTPKASAASQLDIAQAATLAGIPSSPSARDPFLHPQASLARTQDVLQRMYQQNYINKQAYAAALNEIKQPHFLHHSVIHNEVGINFVNYALNELSKELHVKISDLSRSGLLITTTVDLNLQQKVLQEAQQHIADLAQVHHVSNAAEVVIDYHNGAIRTLLGNTDPNNPQTGSFDVASQGYRQPGSSFKPFIYATAFEQGVSPGMPVLDGPLVVPQCCGLPSYAPQDYDLKFHGLITYRYALQNSFNVPAVKLLMKTGVDQSLQTAQKMGITSYKGTPNYTMVLGTLSVHLLDETSAYGVFGNGGVRIPPHAVDTVKDMQGRTILHFQSQGTRVISKQVAYMMTNVLSDNKTRTYEFGPCSGLYVYSNTNTQCLEGNPGTVWPAATKTGTSQDFRDNWTVGYTTDYVVGVWAGNNDNSPMINSDGITGAGPIWHDAMLLAEQGHAPKNFVNPGGLVTRTVTYPEGLTSTDLYLPQPFQP